MRILIVISFLLITNSVYAQPKPKKAHLDMAAEFLGIDLDNKFIKERFFNKKKQEELHKSLVFKEIKYIRGNSREERLTKRDFEKFRHPDMPTDSEIKKVAKKITDKQIENLKEQKAK